MSGWLLIASIVIGMNTGVEWPSTIMVWYFIFRFIWLALFDSGREVALERMIELQRYYHDAQGNWIPDPVRMLHGFVFGYWSFVYNFIAYFGPALFLGYRIATKARDFLNKGGE